MSPEALSPRSRDLYRQLAKDWSALSAEEQSQVLLGMDDADCALLAAALAFDKREDCVRSIPAGRATMRDVLNGLDIEWRH
jgi:hypothetical protein